MCQIAGLSQKTMLQASTRALVQWSRCRVGGSPDMTTLDKLIERELETWTFMLSTASQIGGPSFKLSISLSRVVMSGDPPTLHLDHCTNALVEACNIVFWLRPAIW